MHSFANPPTVLEFISFRFFISFKILDYTKLWDFFFLVNGMKIENGIEERRENKNEDKNIDN